MALRLNGLDQFARQTNTLKLLKLIGEHELRKPSFSCVPSPREYHLGERRRISVTPGFAPSFASAMRRFGRAESRGSLPPRQHPSRGAPVETRGGVEHGGDGGNNRGDGRGDAAESQRQQHAKSLRRVAAAIRVCRCAQSWAFPATHQQKPRWDKTSSILNSR